MIAAIAWLLAVPVTALLAIHAAEVAAGLRPLPAPDSDGAAPRTAVLIPAHDEAGGIGATLAALADEDAEVLVVADNCSDDTAARVRAAGRRVVERHDAERRGKGYALACGRDALAVDPPAVVVVLDADCAVDRGGIAALARACAASGRPVQSCYLFRPDRTAPIPAQLSTFAFLVKNLVRQRGAGRIGDVALLTGSGMAIPWAAFAAAPLASDDIVEDLALGVWLTQAGLPPRFEERARTWSDPAAGADLLTQRGRWERGFVATARRRALPLVVRGLIRGRRAELWLGLHLLVPPLALLFAVGTVLAAALFVAAALGAGWGPPALLAAGLAAAGTATLAAWHVAGRATLGAAALLGAPRYVLAKLPIYRTLFARPAGWVRTRREGEHRDG